MSSHDLRGFSRLWRGLKLLGRLSPKPDRLLRLTFLGGFVIGNALGFWPAIALLDAAQPAMARSPDLYKLVLTLGVPVWGVVWALAGFMITMRGVAGFLRSRGCLSSAEARALGRYFEAPPRWYKDEACSLEEPR